MLRLIEIFFWIQQIFNDWHLVLIVLTITGISVLLLLLEFSIPMLRGTPKLEVDRENPIGHTVSHLFTLLLPNVLNPS